MVLITGSHGFLGSHLRHALRGHDFVCVDPRLPDSPSIEVALKSDYEAMFHLGAISDTTCEDDTALTRTNISLSIRLEYYCETKNIPFIYASSASVYGNGDGPLNAYARSKASFDRWISTDYPQPPHWYGLRFFNVYGPGEEHKGAQMSIVSKCIGAEEIELFTPEARRDFVHVSDVVKVMLWMWKNRPASGIYDVGTGQPRSLREVCDLTQTMLWEIDTPKSMIGKCQMDTRADLTKLRSVGFDCNFLSLEQGIALMGSKICRNAA